MRKKLIGAIVSITLILSMSGCITMKPPKSKIPHFISRLKVHSFTAQEKATIGEILRYVNELEHRR
jgi:Flp pilus assembly protein TadD